MCFYIFMLNKNKKVKKKASRVKGDFLIPSKLNERVN